MLRRTKLDPAVEAELEALDATLAGERRDPELTLIADEVRDGAPTMSPAFAERLERAVEEGFPVPEPARTPRTWRPRLVPALGMAGAACLAIAVGVTALDSSDSPTLSGPPEAALLEEGRARDAGGGTVLPQVAAGAPSATDAAPEAAQSPAPAAGLAQESAGAGQDSSTVVPPPGAGPRRIQRAADLTISTPIAKLQDTSDAVNAVADRAGGYVQQSDVSATGANGSASFDLRIPTDRLDQTLAALSKLGHVRSRSQQSGDITARFSSSLSRLKDARAERQALLRALATAATAQEIESLQARLDIARSRIAAAKGDLASARRASNLARVGVTVLGVSEQEGGAVGGDAPWTPGQALGDALDVLSVAAGVAIVGLAGAIPALLLALLAYLAWRATRRRRRELALDPSAPAV